MEKINTLANNDLKIIDFERKGNVVRFYLGSKTPDWGWTNKDYKNRKNETPDWLEPSDTYYGDDWDDAPYEHNAGQVYDEFIKGHKDIFVDFDDLVLEPCSGEFNSRYSKEDMANRRVPCIIIVPKELIKDTISESFLYWLGVDGVKKYYFGDTIFDKKESYQRPVPMPTIEINSDVIPV